MIVAVGAHQYEIFGLSYGGVPAWKMLRQNGQSITASSFNGLPEEDKHALLAHIQRYIANLRGS